MAKFNPNVPLTQDAKDIALSSRPRQGPPSKQFATPKASALAVGVSGAADLLDASVKVADNIVRRDFTDSLNEFVSDFDKRALDQFLSPSSSSTSTDQIVGNAGEDRLVEQEVPDDIRNGTSRMEELKEARAAGDVTDAYFWSQLNSLTRNLRAKYPGYKDAIDSTAVQIANSGRPANEYLKALQREAEKIAAAKGNSNKKALEIFRSLDDPTRLPGFEHYASALANNQATPEMLSNLIIFEAREKNVKRDIEIEKEKFELSKIRNEIDETKTQRMIDKVIIPETRIEMNKDVNAFTKAIGDLHNQAAGGAIDPQRVLEVRGQIESARLKHLDASAKRFQAARAAGALINPDQEKQERDIINETFSTLGTSFSADKPDLLSQPSRITEFDVSKINQEYLADSPSGMSAMLFRKNFGEQAFALLAARNESFVFEEQDKLGAIILQRNALSTNAITGAVNVEGNSAAIKDVVNRSPLQGNMYDQAMQHIDTQDPQGSYPKAATFLVANVEKMTTYLGDSRFTSRQKFNAATHLYSDPERMAEVFKQGATKTYLAPSTLNKLTSSLFSEEREKQIMDIAKANNDPSLLTLYYRAQDKVEQAVMPQLAQAIVTVQEKAADTNIAFFPDGTSPSHTGWYLDAIKTDRLPPEGMGLIAQPLKALNTAVVSKGNPKVIEDVLSLANRMLGQKARQLAARGSSPEEINSILVAHLYSHNIRSIDPTKVAEDPRQPTAVESTASAFTSLRNWLDGVGASIEQAVQSQNISNLNIKVEEARKELDSLGSTFAERDAAARGRTKNQIRLDFSKVRPPGVR